PHRGHVDRARGDRGPPGGHGDPRLLAHHEPRRGHLARASQPHRGAAGGQGCRAGDLRPARTRRGGDLMEAVEALAAARAWAAQDPDEVTRAQLEALIARADAGDPDAHAELASRFAGRLTFGTAGLRGELGAGPLRMNRVLVSQAAAGLARFLLARETHPSVVIG